MQTLAQHRVVYRAEGQNNARRAGVNDGKAGNQCACGYYHRYCNDYDFECLFLFFHSLSPSYFSKWFAIGDPSEESDKIILPENFWDDEVIEGCGYVEPSDLSKERENERAELLDKYLEF